MKVVVIGSQMMLANVIEGLLDAGHEVAGVLYKKRPWWQNTPEKTLIKEYKFHEIKCKSANSEKFKRELLRLNADVLIVAMWHERLKKEIFDTPTLAAINVHPSLLPQYRGPNPYLETIRNQEKMSGLTIHLIDEDFDHGAILAQEQVEILPGYTGRELREQTVLKARYLTSAVLKRLETGEIVPVAQEHDKATYYPAINPVDMLLDFEGKTADQIHAQIRAFHPWYPCYAKFGRNYYIADPYRTRVSEVQPQEGLFKQCKDGQFIVLHHARRVSRLRKG